MGWLYRVEDNCETAEFLADLTGVWIVDADRYAATWAFDDQHIEDAVREDFPDFKGYEETESFFVFELDHDETVEYLTSLGMQPLNLTSSESQES
jgi:hypothetical protein